MDFLQIKDRVGEKALILLFSLIPAIALFLTHQSGIPLSYDFGGHISRIYILLNDGFGWTDMWYNGHAFLAFYPPLYHLIFSVVGAISIDLVRPASFGLLGFTAFLSMYAYTSRYLDFYRSMASGFLFLTGWLLYIAHISGSMPQAFAAALVPVFYSELEKSLDGGTPVYAGVLGSLVILFHHNAGFVAALGAALLLILNYRKDFWNAAAAGFISLGVSAFWLLPALINFSDVSYSFNATVGARGLENVIFLMPLFAAPLLLKMAASVDSIAEYRDQAAIGALGLFLSLSIFSGITDSIPVISFMPPYRFYLLGAFATAFLASASRKSVLTLVVISSVLISGFAIQEFDDRGFRPGQEQTYRYLETQDVNLLYDDESTDIRAYAITVHGKDIADGWSIDSTPLRPGLQKFSTWQRQNNSNAVNFLRKWSADTIITYRYAQDQRNLNNLVKQSELYRLDRCFEKVCVYRANFTDNRTEYLGNGVYRVNTSETLPIPYSSNFNVSAEKTENGFMKIDRDGIKAVKYRRSSMVYLGFLVSFLTIFYCFTRESISVFPMNHVKYFKQ